MRILLMTSSGFDGEKCQKVAPRRSKNAAQHLTEEQQTECLDKERLMVRGRGGRGPCRIYVINRSGWLLELPFSGSAFAFLPTLLGADICSLRVCGAV
jgi:hypothetical protein